MKALVVVLVSLAVLVAAPVAAQPGACVPAPAARNVLEQYGEKQLGTGVSSSGVVLIILVNPETRTWTVVGRPAIEPPIWCLLDSGGDWEFGSPGEAPSPEGSK